MTTTPEALRDAGIEQATNAADPRLILAVDAVIAQFNATGEPWSANDIRDLLPVVAGPLVGARVRAASLRKPREMEAVGWTRSSLRSTHAKPLVRWRGVR